MCPQSLPSWTLSTVSRLCNKILRLREDQVRRIYAAQIGGVLLRPRHSFGGGGGVFCSQPMRCGQGTLLRCQEACSALLSCGEHACLQVCHDGACRPCQIQVQQGESASAETTERRRRFPGGGVIFFKRFQRVTVVSFAADRCVGRIKRRLMVPDISPAENSAKRKCERKERFNCVTCALTRALLALRMLSCGFHRCQQQCHPGPCEPCPLSPSLVKTCPCGQTPLAKLLELGYSQRGKCTDPVPSCGKTCNRPLACGSSGEKGPPRDPSVLLVEVGISGTCRFRLSPPVREVVPRGRLWSLLPDLYRQMQVWLQDPGR